MQNFRKNINGITLISLVVTIIILLILAGISIAMLSGDNGLLKRAGQARDDTIVGQEKEQVELAYVSAAVKNLGGNVTGQNLQNELDASVGENKTTVTGTSTLKVKFEDTQNEYKVSQDGKVEKKPSYNSEVVSKLVADPTGSTVATKSPYVMYNENYYRVLYGADSDYGIELVSVNTIGEQITLGKNDPAGNGAEDSGDLGTFERAKWSYNNAITTLNAAAQKCIVASDGIVEYARCIGSDPKSPYDPELSKVAYIDNEKAWMETKGFNGIFKSGDHNVNIAVYTETDKTDRGDYKQMKILGITDSNNAYWLASRYIGDSFGTQINPSIYYVSNNSLYYNGNLGWVNSSGEVWCRSLALGLRPVIHLASGVKITGGDGKTAETAYTLGL